MDLSDSPAERAILAGLCQFNSNVYLDITDILQETTFTDDINSALFRCVKHVLEKDDEARLDIALLQSVANEIGLSYIFKQKQDYKYIQALFTFPIQISNVRKFAVKIRKLEIAKLLHKQLGEAQNKILEIKGDESITHILGIAEDSIFDFTSLLNEKDNNPEYLGNNIQEYLQYLKDNPVEQIGISTGFPAYDQAIGGGLRPATINIIAARPKLGKTICSDNIGYYIANQSQIPVLNLDTEMTKEDHIHRTLAMMNEIPINVIETGKFTQKPDWEHKVFESGKQLEKIPYYYKNITGKPFEDQLAIMRKWLMQEVGLNSDGTAKSCLIIYDYIKLMDAQGISSDMKEYQLLGFMMTTLHNFATRYKIPILALMQLNRDGITKEGTETASGSDRIIWLCSNFTILKMKSDEEISEDGIQYGNRKLVPIVARHGPGLDYRDYINCEMKGWCAKIIEGKTKFELEAMKNQSIEGFVTDDNGPIKFK